jgi:hypothetical protein
MLTTIRLTNGKTRKVERIVDYINSDGIAHSVAYGRKSQYVVVDHDYCGAIWGQVREPKSC